MTRKFETPARELLLSPDSGLRRIQRAGIAAALVGAVACAAGAAGARDEFYQAYLVAFLFWLGPALGSLGVLMLQHVTGGRWGIVLRRVLEAGAATLPLMALLFVPVLFGLHSLYEWSRAGVTAHDAILAQKQPYLNVPFFVARAVLYFATWIAVAWCLVRWSRRLDEASDPRLVRRTQMLSRGGLILYGLTMTFAAFDWGMSIEPHWYSHIYGVLVIGGQALSAMAFAIVVAAALARQPAIGRWVTADRFHDLGKLLLAFVMLWAYFSFSQYLIIWSGDLPEEIPWYLHRLAGGWRAVGIALIVFHFAVPFVVLLSREVKRRPGALAAVAVGLLVLRWVEVYWLVVPTFHPTGLFVHWLAPATAVAMGGLWLAAFVRFLDRAPLLPVGELEALLEED
ncbi:MAG: hypothetical protein D6815_00860 [Candidatus Dadabacteria bacterium]|nr:MAG: hypothetical protein D6815_00860 [Candidatus Dadabacteria bacterium]